MLHWSQWSAAQVMEYFFGMKVECCWYFPICFWFVICWCKSVEHMKELSKCWPNATYWRAAAAKRKEQNWFAKWRVHVGKGLVIHYKCEGRFPQRRGRSKERAYKRKIEKRRGISLEQWVIIHHFLRWRRKLGGEGGCFPQRQRQKKKKEYIYTKLERNADFP